MWIDKASTPMKEMDVMLQDAEVFEGNIILRDIEEYGVSSDQKALFENKEPAVTVGSLCEKVMTESLMGFIEEIVSSDDPKTLFEQHADKISELFELRSSIKHLRHHADIEFLSEKL